MVNRFMKMGQLTDRILNDLCIVACCYPITVQFVGLLKKITEFNLIVALNTGIRSSILEVLMHKIINYLVLKNILRINDIKRNIDFITNSTGIVCIDERTTSASETLNIRSTVIPQLHVNTYDLITLC